MRPYILLLLVSTVACLYLPTPEEKKAAWDKLTIVSKLADATPDGFELALVNAIWRHGDRSPTDPFVGDVLTEADWTFGGGGYGELSPIGMKQHFDLGRKLWKRYAENNQYLSELYKSQEIYVRSTDRNRTLASAMSNMAGMYSRTQARKGTDYPDMNGWPNPYIPVPIHTVDRTTDHMGDPETQCNRQDDLWDLAHQTAEYINYEQSYDTQEILNYLREKTNARPEDITFDNIYHVWDGMKCEKIHFPTNFSTWYPWYTEDINQRTADVNNKNIDLQNGIFADGVINGIDLTVEIPMIRGGPLLNEVTMKGKQVLDCYKKTKYGENNSCKDDDHFLQRLKYYVVSSHDDTVFAYMTALGATKHVMKTGGYPEYTSAVFTEFFLDTRNGGSDLVFRLLYHDDPTVDFRVVTPFVEGCPLGEDFCPLSALQKLADKLNPPGGIDAWCEVRL